MTLVEQPVRHEQEPRWSEKVVRLHDVLSEHNIPYAFGGAIALNYHREPRSTLDIDINIFLPPNQEAPVLETFAKAYGIDVQAVSQDLRQTGQSRSIWGETYVDLFFADTEFHEAMGRRIERKPFGDREISVLSIEDLLVCKVAFDRPKDWLDIASVAEAEGERLDADYMKRTLQLFFDPNEPRFKRLQQILETKS